jgi:DNA segregation ATPase FtsK/SpoIIIE-like protein
MHFDQNKSIGALGTLIVAKWYRVYHPQHLLISLDSAETRRWMNLDDDARRADLLGLSVENGEPVIDILECKSGVEDATHVYTLDNAGEISGKPIEQLINTGKSVAAIFGLNEWKDHVLTPPRREILRNHLYRQGLSGRRSKEEKQFWSRFLNDLFSGNTKPTIRLNLILVNLGLNQEPLDEEVVCDQGKIRLVHLNEEVVSLHLSGGRPTEVAPEADEMEPVKPDEDYEGKNADEESLEEEDRIPTPSQEAQTPGELKDHLRVTCAKIKAACQDFGIKVTEIDPDKVDIGPSVLRYKIKLAPGEEASRLRKKAEDIARQLAATSIPIIGFLPGTHYEYLDLARPDRQTVQLEPVLASTKLRDVNHLPLHIGINPGGQPTCLDLGDDKLPHILVAGGTGSGKTIFLYSVVLSLVTVHSEKTLELVVIDPKQTDFTIFGKIKHLRGGEVITEADSGVEAVREIAEHEMQSRSDILQKAKCRDIKSYNTANPKKPMRSLVVVIDEYADLVAVLSKKEKEEFERVISRITARGRNVGIHLILATQRPTADIVTGNIKANMACRISFSLPSSRDSQVILDEPGAERLLRHGDMLLMHEGKLTRLQGYYVDPQRIEGLLKR